MADPRDTRPDANRLLLAALLALVLLLTAGLVFGQELGTPRLDPDQAMRSSQLAIGTVLPDYVLQDGDGRPVSLARFRGRPLLLSFVYTGCFSACPTATRFLREAVADAQRTLGTGTFNVVTIGFNVPFDSPAAMRDFRRRHGADLAQWEFLAADAATIDALARAVGFSWRATAAGFDHVTQLTLIDPAGRVAAQIYGETFPLPQLVGPLKAMVTATPLPGNVGGWIERMRLLCTVYDARAGRYSIDYRLIIELGAGLSVLLATLGYLGREWRRHRRLRHA